MNRSLALAAMAALLAGCGPRAAEKPGTRPITIGVSLFNLSSEYIGRLDRAIESEAGKAGVKVVVVDAQLEAERQIRQVEGFIAEKADAIILNPVEVYACSPAVDKAHAAGIPIVNVNSETHSAPTSFVGSRDEDSGRMAMEYIVRRLHGKGNVVMMGGHMGQAAEVERTAGAKAVLAGHPGMKVLAEQSANWDRDQAMTLMENWIQAFGPRIDGVFAQNDEMAMGCVVALEHSGYRPRVVVVGVDGIRDALRAVRGGRLDATVFQNAEGQGTATVDTALRIIRHQPYQKQVLIPFQLVTRDNVDRFQP